MSFPRSAIAAEILEDRTLLSVFTVTNTLDRGPGTLRQAILDANANAGLDTIQFNIPADDPGHVYYRDEGLAGQVSPTSIATTAAVDDADLPATGPDAVDPDWAQSWYTIQPASALPGITDAVTIDGYTQPGARQNTNTVESRSGLNTILRIELDGSAAGAANGLTITAADSTVRGLAINRFGTIADFFSGAGILINGSAARGNTIEGSYIGTDVSGTLIRGNRNNGLVIVDAPDNTIGGPAAEARNLISGNFTPSRLNFGSGVVISRSQATGNVVEGNLIGTDASGTRALGNGPGTVLGPAGVLIAASDNLIQANVISGNNHDGVRITGTDGRRNVLRSNLLGTDVTGTEDLGNAFGGVLVDNGASGNAIGGSDPGDGNVVSGNDHNGILIDGDPRGAPLNVIQGNWIGTDVTGRFPIGNGRDGVSIFGASLNMVGGTAAGAGNVISGNAGDGVSVPGTSSLATGNAILSNVIVSNGGLGIDLGLNGVTPNDPGDADAGPNDLQNSPVLTGASSGSTTAIQGTLNSTAHGTFRIEFFSNTTADPSGHGEGETSLGSTRVTTDASGNAGFTVTLPAAVPVGRFVTATATRIDRDPDGDQFRETSEFSQAVEVASGAVFGSVVDTTADVADPGDGITSLREAIDFANVNPGLDTIHFDIPADDPRHFYYRDDGVAGQVSRDQVTPTTAADDAMIADIDPDWPHSWFSIQVAAELPKIVEAVTIDGLTQPGASPNTNPASSGLGLNSVLRIELDGSASSAVSGLFVETAEDNTLVRGLAVFGFGFGILVVAGVPAIQGNYLGTDISGTVGLGNSGGIATLPSVSMLVGGTTPEARNLISGNLAFGIQGGGLGTRIEGNLIGTNAQGTAGLLSLHGTTLATLVGVDAGNDVTIGGTDPDARNVISGANIANVGFDEGMRSQVQGNFIGTDVTGTRIVRAPVDGGPSSETFAQVRITSEDNLIGGTEPGAGNVIAGGVFGVSVNATGQRNRIEGNLIGTDASGLNALGAVSAAIAVSGDDNVVGGTSPGAGNVISGALGVGVGLSGTGNVIQGNWIGTNSTGAAALPNGLAGVSISGLDNVIGGAEPGAGNVISGNGVAGIRLFGGPLSDDFIDTRRNRVEGNLIGTAADGTAPLGNLGHGVWFDGITHDNVIGGTAAGAGNVIAFNGGAGVFMEPDNLGNAIVQNAIFSNAGLGIDLLLPAGVNDNDVGDTDKGANNIQNFPIITTVAATPGDTTIEGTLHSTPNTSFRAEFFTNAIRDPSGHGEGETFLGARRVTTDAEGNASFSVTLPTPVRPDHFYMTATATVVDTATGRLGDTSEFSPAFEFAPPQPASLHGQKFDDLNGNGQRDPGEPGLDGWTVQLFDGNLNLLAEQTTMSMDLDGDGSIDPQTERGLYWFADLDPGEYVLGEVRRSGWKQTFPRDIRFRAAQFNAGDRPTGVAAGDLDGDGDSDLAVANINSDTVSVLLNEGDGTFGAPQSFAVGQFPRAVAAGDVDRDGDLDLVVANGDSNDVSVLLNLGDGTFADAMNFEVGTDPQAVALGDFNGDGSLDAAVANDSGSVSLLFNNGSLVVPLPPPPRTVWLGFAKQIAFAAGAEPRSLAAGDLDGDGDLDLAVANRGAISEADSVSVLLNDGIGGFNLSEALAVDGALAAITITDPDGDGDSDLVVALSDLNARPINVFLNQGDATFAPPNPFAAGLFPSALAPGDFDGDGDQDLAASNLAPGVSVLLNDGAGGLGSVLGVAAPFDSVASITTADFDLDGDLDLARTNGTTGSASVLTNLVGTHAGTLLSGQTLEGLDFGNTAQPATLHWVAQADGLWDDPLNWDAGRAPIPGDLVIIDVPNVDVTVTYTGGDLAIEDLQLAETLVIGTGTLTVDDEAEVTGTLVVTGTLSTGGGVQLTGGAKLAGTGLVSGPVSNIGSLVTPGLSFGILTIDGDYTQTADGVLELEVGGSTPGSEHDQLIVTGTATLAGTLRIIVVGNALGVGEELELIAYGSLLGAPGAVEVLDPADALTFDLAFGPGGLIATAFPVSNVIAEVVGGRLVISGDEADNALRIELGAAGSGTVRVAGREGTRINGSSEPAEFSGVHNLRAELAAGDDSVHVSGPGLPGLVKLDGGTGHDVYGLATRNTWLAVVDAGGRDWLDFGQASHGVHVNLAKDRGQPQSIGGGNHVRLNGTIENVIASAHHDLLFGNDADNILVGTAGIDFLFGRGGRDILIGGEGSDFLFGGHGEDVLIAGSTAYDRDRAALAALLAEWTSDRDYDTRVANLRDGSGSGERANESLFLNSDSVEDDGEPDFLFGGRGRDLFFAKLDEGARDLLFGRRFNELVEELELGSS